MPTQRLPFRCIWSRPARGFEVQVHGGIEVLVPRLGMGDDPTWETDEIPESETEKVRGSVLPRLSRLRWPIASQPGEGSRAGDSLLELGNALGLLLDSGLDAERAAAPFAASTTALRVGIFELQLAQKLRRAIEQRGPFDLVVRDEAGRWRIEVPVPEGLERVEQGPLRRLRGSQGRGRFVLDLPIKGPGYEASLCTERLPAAKAARAVLCRSAWRRWVHVTPGEMADAPAVELRSPLGAAWYDEVGSPELLECPRCGQLFTASTLLRRGHARFCHPGCRRAFKRKAERESTAPGKPARAKTKARKR